MAISSAKSRSSIVVVVNDIVVVHLIHLSLSVEFFITQFMARMKRNGDRELPC
jgi:hypothetical protein